MTKSVEINPNAQLLRPEQAAAYIGVCRRQIYNLAESDPQFPRKITLTARAVGWLRADLDNWLQSKIGAA